MTLVIGIKCSDGVVLGSDGAATLTALGSRTIIQPTKKLYLLKGPLIAGFSGPVGMAQRLSARLETVWPQVQRQRPDEVMTRLRNEFWQLMEPEYKIAIIAKDLLGPTAAAGDAICLTLVAGVLSGQPELISLDQQGSPELASQGLPFVSIGSGQSIADPFLAFLRRLFWPDKLPSITDGIFATLWTLDQAIKISPGGVAEPVQIAVLRQANDTWGALELDEAQLQEHQEAIAAAEQSLIDFKQHLSGRGPSAAPPIP